MDEYNINHKKRAGIFTVNIILADFLIRAGGDMLASHFTKISSDTANYDTVNQIISVCLSAFSLVLIFLVSYIFTKDRKKAVIFAGSIYFGKEAAVLIRSPISTVAKILTSATLISRDASSVIVNAGNILTLPLMIALAYLSFTAFEGINTGLNGNGLGNSGMLLSQAKKRYFTAYIIVMIVSGIMTSGSSFVFAYLTSYGIIDFARYSMIFSVVAQLLNCLSTLFLFAILYRTGYKPFRSHINGMSFISVSGLAGAVSSIFTGVATIPMNMLLNNSENLALGGALSAITGVAGFIALAVDIIAAIYFLKFFFPKYEISLFADNIPADDTYGEKYNG